MRGRSKERRGEVDQRYQTLTKEEIIVIFNVYLFIYCYHFYTYIKTLLVIIASYKLLSLLW